MNTYGYHEPYSFGELEKVKMDVADLMNTMGVTETVVERERVLVARFWEKDDIKNFRYVTGEKGCDEPQRILERNTEVVMLRAWILDAEIGMVELKGKMKKSEKGNVQLSDEMVELPT